jgi:hypothetical protein
MATTSNSSPFKTPITTLATVVPEIRTLDQTWRRKYLQDFSQAFLAYERILDSSELQSSIAAASVILVGDYHSLPACQNFVAKLIKDCARSKPVVLAVETIFSRDQHILDEWWRQEIDEAELRQRIRFDLDWGYDWDPFYKLLVTARQRAEAVFGLDCMPREDLRKIGIRDRHAAHKLAEVRRRHPNATLVAFIGESHLAPSHLPALAQKELPHEKLFTVLQNVDPLYWAASRENPAVQAVRVDARTACIFNATPLEKYESYRHCLDSWRTTKNDPVDFAPAIYGLIDRWLRFLDINRYSPSNGKQPKYLIDLLPEVIDYSSKQFLKLLASVSDETLLLAPLQERGCLYIPQCNTFVVQRFHSEHVAAEAARFVHHACQGLGSFANAIQSEPQSQRLTSEKLERALAYLGSRILCAGASNSGTASNVENGDTFGKGLHQAFLKGTLSRSDLKRIFLFPVSASGKAAELCSHLCKRLKLNF